jgi:hypothetical protein
MSDSAGRSPGSRVKARSTPSQARRPSGCPVQTGPVYLARRLQLQGQPRLWKANLPHRIPHLSPFRGTGAISGSRLAPRSGAAITAKRGERQSLFRSATAPMLRRKYGPACRRAPMPYRRFRARRAPHGHPSWPEPRSTSLSRLRMIRRMALPPTGNDVVTRRGPFSQRVGQETDETWLLALPCYRKCSVDQFHQAGQFVAREGIGFSGRRRAPCRFGSVALGRCQSRQLGGDIRQIGGKHAPMPFHTERIVFGFHSNAPIKRERSNVSQSPHAQEVRGDDAPYINKAQIKRSRSINRR